MAAPAAGAGAGAGAAPTADLITPFFNGDYSSKVTALLEHLLAIADTIHDFGKGYRTKPSGDGKSEILRFLLAEAGAGAGGSAVPAGYIRQLLRSAPAAPNPYQSVLINGYNNIEAINREYFENQAGVNWITPITAEVKMENVVGNDNPVKMAEDLRNNHISIELVPPSDNYINSLDEARLTKLREFLITFLFARPDVGCYFASDAQPKSVGKILKESTSARGIVFPQTISDSAPTALDGKLTQLVDHYYFPCDDTGGLVFTSRANTFTRGVFTVTYQNGSSGGKDSFSLDTPYAWRQVINAKTAPGAPSATLQYSATGGKEGPSLDQLLELQVKTHRPGTPGTIPSVTPATTRQIKLSDVAGFSSIYPTIKTGIDANAHSLYLDLKRSGDQDQCLAVSYARRDLSPYVALITGDITCAVKNRSYDNPTIEHYNDRIRLYRSSRTATTLTSLQLAQLEYNKLRARAEKLEPIMKLFCIPAEKAKIAGYIRTIEGTIRVKDSDKAADIAGYLGLLTVVTDRCDPAPTSPLPGRVDVNAVNVSVLTISNRELNTFVDIYETNLKRIQTAIQSAASPDYSAPSVEFLNWFATNCMITNIPTGAIPELNYDPTLTIPANLPNFLTASYPAPIDIISEIDKYNSAIIKYCNMLFSASLKETLLNEKLYKFNATYGDSDDVEKMRTILTKLYHISLKTTLRLHGLEAPTVYDLFWKTAKKVLSYVQQNSDYVFTRPAGTNIKTNLGKIVEDIKTTLMGKDTAIDYILEGIGDGGAGAGARAAAGTGARVRSRRAVPAAAVIPVRVSTRKAGSATAAVMAAARTAGSAGAGAGAAIPPGIRSAGAVPAGMIVSSEIGVGHKRTRATPRGGGRRITLRRQRGGAPCITKIDIVDELMDFFGYVAADFRTIVYTAYPLLGLYIRALTLKATKAGPNEIEELVKVILPAPSAAAGAGAEGDENTDMNGAAGTARAANINDIISKLWNIVQHYTLKDCLESISNSLDFITETRKRQEYIELFKSNVVVVFTEKWMKMTSEEKGFCLNYMYLLNYIWNILTNGDIRVGRGVMYHFNLDEIIILISYIYDILLSKDKNYRSFIRVFSPKLFGVSRKAYTEFAGGYIDLTSDVGVGNIPTFINNYQNEISQYLPSTVALEDVPAVLAAPEEVAIGEIASRGTGAAPAAKRARKDVTAGASDGGDRGDSGSNATDDAAANGDGDGGGGGDDSGDVAMTAQPASSVKPVPMNMVESSEGGAYRHRRTKRRYSAQQYRKRTKTSRRRRQQRE